MGWLSKIKADGGKVQSLDKVPALLDYAKWLWRAWETLSAKRLRNDAGPQPIAMEAILAYVQYEEIHEETRRDDLLLCLTALDGVYIEHALKQREDAARKRAKKNKRR